MVMADIDIFQCGVCKLHYRNKDDADKCEKWCSQNNSCNLEIARNSIEASENKKSLS